MTIALNQGNSESEYKALIDLLAVFSEASVRLSELQARADAALLETVDGERKEFAELSTALEETDKAIKDLATKHPEWADGRTIKTPYGTVRFTRTTKLKVPSPEATVALIRSKIKDHDPTEFIRTREEPDLEALDRLDDSILAKVGIIRETTDSVSIKPAKVDLGKTGDKKGKATA
jgi:hypothetical protein